MFKLFTIKKEAAIAAISGVIGALAAQGVEQFTKGIIGTSFPEIIANLLGFGIFFIILLFSANFLFKRVDERTIKASEK